MKYWAVSRRLGLTENEFWQSTLAKITALYRVQVLTWDYTRDFFVSELVAVTLNKLRTKKEDHIFTAEDIVSRRYPRFKSKSVTVTPGHDPDFGAAGGADLKSSLKGVTEKRKRNAARRAKRGK